MSALAVFSFQEEHQVRVVMINGDPWFVAKLEQLSAQLKPAEITNKYGWPARIYALFREGKPRSRGGDVCGCSRVSSVTSALCRGQAR
ncbi:hypothetical protein PVD38_004508 [Escherichia coli]|uniref:hypothetical protein n=1 Tax=Escherichia coli TaxID=562 RepID=UPI00259DB552|nr:hypothetical protein [Shigella sonnei]EJF3537182.1 hypothetical protein [Escherichia coli]EKM5239421.1 hypothetical protein [Escherichia coli]EKV5766202.1 hypothetical protein [Escherichia coli]EKX7384592.1 hypothetical protein [Escherichia coli]